MKYYFTSATESYLPNARVLAKSIKKYNPEACFILLFNDIEENEISWNSEPFDEVIHVHKLGIPNFYNLVFRYSVIEFCTAVKGYFARYILQNRDADSVIYVDPDCEVFSPMNDLYELLNDHDVVLTPHITDVNYTDEGIESHEIAALKHGTFNLGFFAVANTENGIQFLDWWSDRLIRYSDIDFQRGLFTDQKWCNLAPYMFKGVHVLLDRAYNAATWNMNGRLVTRDNYGEWQVNGQPLRFYHFSGFGFDFGWADRELAMFSNGDDTIGIWDQYKEKYARESKEKVSPGWHWANFENGLPILPETRRAYKSIEYTDVLHARSSYEHLSSLISHQQ